MNNDPGGLKDASGENPAIIKRPLALTEKEKAALGAFDNYGPEVRKTIRVLDPIPLYKKH